MAAAGAWPSASFGPILGDMAGLKITPTSAMRARDVSRPRAEHLAAAAEREDAVTRRGDRPANAAIPAAIARSAARPAAVTAPTAPGATAPASAAPVPSAPVPSARKAATPPTDVEPAATPLAGMPLAGMPLAGAEPAGAEPATDGEPVDARRRRRGR